MMSKKLEKKILTPRHVGIFTTAEATARQMHLATGLIDRVLKMTFLIDPTDGMVVDARFYAYGPAVLIGLAEAAAELTIGKYWDQVARMSADLIESSLHDKPGQPATSAASLLNVVVDVLDAAMQQCRDIPLPPDYVSPLPHDIEVTEGGWHGFASMTVPQKLAVIEEVVKEEIRPYIELDGGGIEVINLLGNEVIIAYEGSCTTCYSSTGATLSYIQQLLQAKVFPDLIVTPKMDPFITE